MQIASFALGIQLKSKISFHQIRGKFQCLMCRLHLHISLLSLLLRIYVKFCEFRMMQLKKYHWLLLSFTFNCLFILHEALHYFLIVSAFVWLRTLFKFSKNQSMQLLLQVLHKQKLFKLFFKVPIKLLQLIQSQIIFATPA